MKVAFYNIIISVVMALHSSMSNCCFTPSFWGLSCSPQSHATTVVAVALVKNELIMHFVM